MYARHITNENSVDDSYPELFDARELGDSDGGRVAASHGAHLDVHLEVALDSERKTVFDEGFSPSGTVDSHTAVPSIEENPSNTSAHIVI